ncbi:MAG: photosystem reaction center subunit [Enterovirga sp.]|nr:photosystem reaction center subunit [Enterovirga sp.]
MIRTTTALVLTTMLAGTAFAQTSSTTTSPAATTSVAGQASTASTGQFLTEQGHDQFRASKFVGLGIYGTDNQRVGDINEILIDSTGNAKAIVIGVGGFLGIGEKNVAVPFSMVEWKMTRPTDQTAAAASPAMTPANRPAGTAADTTGSTATGAATTGSTATASTMATTAATRNPADTAAANGYPDHGMIKMSKADLQNAPAFKWYSDTRTTSGGASAVTTTPTTTPARQ